MQMIPLTELTQLDEIDFRSKVRKQVILKHSTRCHISKIILGHVNSDLSKVSDDAEYDFYYLDLLKHRDISNEIAKRYRVTHQSPQLLIIENAHCSYNTSHGQVDLGNAGLLK